MSQNKPRLRWPLRVTRVPVAGQPSPGILLQCPLEIAQPLVLSAGCASVLAQLDGNKEINEILSIAKVPASEINLLQSLITALDESLLLDNERFWVARDKVVEEFLVNPTRAAFLAGKAYPSAPNKLTSELRIYLQDGFVYPSEDLLDLKTLITPHIDYTRGRACYGRIFGALRGNRTRTVVVIGTSHQAAHGIFHTTAKNFATPLGLCQTDQDFLADLERNVSQCGYPALQLRSEELLHRTEHSLELQLPFIKLLMPDAFIVPILVGSVHQFLDNRANLVAHDEYGAFVEGFTATYKKWDQQDNAPLILAGVDMAHVGSQFGDDFVLTDDRMAGIGERDQEYLKHVFAVDPIKLFEHVAEDNDARRLCGFSTLHTILDVFTRLPMSLTGKVIDYRQAVNVPEGCGVTFAGAILRARTQ